MCKICDLSFNELNELFTLIISNCNSIVSIPQLNRLRILSISNCDNINLIPIH